jgi:hypothetical protein
MIKSLLSESINNLWDYTHTFYCTAIADNGKLEGAANFFLQEVRICLTGFKGRQVTLLEGEYKLDGETFSIEFPDDLFFNDGKGLIALVILVSTIVGTLLKLVAWIAIPGVLKKNRTFVHLQREELKKYHHWSLNCKVFNKILSEKPCLIINFKNSVLKELQPFTVPEPLLEGIAYALVSEKKTVGKQHLAAFSLVSKACFLKAYFVQKQSQLMCSAKINRIFPSIFLNWIYTIQIQPLADCPEMRLPAHRISADPTDLTIQKYRCANSQNTNFLSAKDMQPYPIKWGENPVPFIAIQVHYSQPDRRFILGFFTRLAKRCKLKKNNLRDHHQVILIYQKASKVNDDRWSIKFPWKKKAIYLDSPKEKQKLPVSIHSNIQKFLNLTKNDFSEKGLILPPDHSLLN